jgi:von Willebrand factor A domain-containing protein 8
VTGDKNIFKRRGYADPDADPTFQGKKRIRFVMDCSGSMYRFNGYDQRLNRSLEATALIMESFVDMEHQFDYSIVGHSGDSACISLVEFGNPPQTALDRMRILQSMVAHTQYCQSGDNTLPAIHRAMLDVSTAEVDQTECYVVAISDANLYRYGISPKDLGQIMRGQSMGSTANVPKAFCVFIASFGEEANEIKRVLPLGR